AFAEPLSVEEAAPAGAIDPAVEITLRDALRSRLGRAPSSAELQQEIRLYDKRIATLNAALASHRAEFAAAYKKTGRTNRALENAILGIVPHEEITDPAYRDAMRRVLSTLVNNTANGY